MRQLVRMLAHPLDHFTYLRAIRAARTDGLAPGGMLMSVKYLGIYLAEFLTPEMRRRAIIFHYALVAQRLTQQAQRCAWRSGSIIWSRRVTVSEGSASRDLMIILEDARLSPMEGESQLRFTMDGLTLCTLSFAFLPGVIVGSTCAGSMFIGGVQGGINCREDIRMAAKANGEISPSAMVMIAARAMVEAMSIDTIVGVSSEFQAAMGYAAEKISLNYDRLWLESGAIRCDTGLFSIVPGSGDKPLEEIAQSHRARTRRKRELKAELKAEMRRTIEHQFNLVAPDIGLVREIIAPPPHAPAVGGLLQAA